MRTSPPEYSPETGLLRLAEVLHVRYGSRIHCTEPQCSARTPAAVFLKDCGGKQDAEGRRRRLWKCRYASSCGRKITCTRYVKIARETLDSSTFGDIVVGVRDERASRGIEDRDWGEWLTKPTTELLHGKSTPKPFQSKPTTKPVLNLDSPLQGTKRKASPSRESPQGWGGERWCVDDLRKSPNTPDETVARKLFQTPQEALTTPQRRSGRFPIKKVCLAPLSDPIEDAEITPEPPAPAVDSPIPPDLWALVRRVHAGLGELLGQDTAPTPPAKSVKSRIPTPYPPHRTAARLALEFGKCRSPEERRSLRDEAKASGPRFLQLFNRQIRTSKQGTKSTRG